LIVKLQDKVAIVTGTSPNIGGAIAEALADGGAAIVCVDANAENARDCAKAITGGGGRAIGIVCNVCNETDVAQAVQEAVAAFGRVDILVNNAALFNKKGVLDMTLVEWNRQIEVILTGTFLFTKHVARSMIDRGVRGNVINIISTAGHQGEPGNIAYSTAKCGLLNFTRSAAMELAAHGIRVNSLTPTATDPSESDERATRWGRSVHRNAAVFTVMETFRRRIPMLRLPVASDYGRAAVFLASDDASMVTGTDLRIDAGAVARYWAWEPTAAQ
jgi:NAD(P)-dependent dehydrogenase (short-subunit alcohol dehydrogenase family)